MESNPKTYFEAIKILQSPAAFQKIASSQGISDSDKTFRELYQSTIKEAILILNKQGIAPSSPVSEEQSEKFLNGFLYMLMAKYGIQQHFKTLKQLYATDKDGWSKPLSGSLNEDFDDWTEADRKLLIQQLKDGNYIARIKHQYAKFHPHNGDADFHKALRFALDIAMQQVEKYFKPPLMPSDLEEMVDGIQELVLSFEPAKSIFFSDDSKKKPKETPKPASDPNAHKKFQHFSKGNKGDGTPYTIGLNESIEDWTQTKLDQRIKQEVEKLLKKGEYMSKKEVKDMIRKTIVQQYKYLWEKSAFFINQI